MNIIMINNKKVLIMLASFNGHLYIKEQIESIFKQSYTNFDLLISDDASSDNTETIIEDYQKNNKLYFIKNQKLHGAFWNFVNLVNYARNQLSSYDYYMFSDQDDYWLHDKIESSVAEIEKYNCEIPQLVYTSKQYVDKSLNLLSYNTPQEDQITIKKIIHQNLTYGCTYIFNKALLNLLDSTPPIWFINYDHYTLTQAYIFGEVHFLNKKSILYRQHEDNVSGNIYTKKWIKIFFFKKRYDKNIFLYKQLISYFYIYKTHLNSNDFNFINILYRARLSRLNLTLKSITNNVRKNTFISTILFYISLLITKH